jgi:hypothetical protein
MHGGKLERRSGNGKLNLERFHKYCSHAVGKDEEAVFLVFWPRFGPVTGPSGHAPSPKLLQNTENPRSAWLQYFFKRSI